MKGFAKQLRDMAGTAEEKTQQEDIRSCGHPHDYRVTTVETLLSGGGWGANVTSPHEEVCIRSGGDIAARPFFMYGHDGSYGSFREALDVACALLTEREEKAVRLVEGHESLLAGFKQLRAYTESVSR